MIKFSLLFFYSKNNLRIFVELYILIITFSNYESIDNRKWWKGICHRMETKKRPKNYPILLCKRKRLYREIRKNSLRNGNSRPCEVC